MSNGILVSVMAAGCLSRFRNGVQFTRTPKEIEVTQSELAVLQADSYLKVTVIDDDNNNGHGLADNQSTDTNASADPTTTDAANKADTKSTAVSEKYNKRLDIVESMRELNLDWTADKPSVKELKALGLDVSAKERDAAWDQLIAEHNKKSDA